MKILICEDELIIAEFLKETCLELGYEVCAVAGSKAEAIDKIVYHHPDLILVDINMESRYSGIELAHYINQTVKKPFIFITAFSDVDTINQAVLAQPHAYLVKPVDKNTLLANIQLARYKYSNTQTYDDEYVQFTTENGGHQINVAQLLYIEASGNYCEFVFTTHERELLRISMQAVETTLDDKFIRVHKSFIINPHFITGSSSLKVLLGNQSIPVGRTYKPNLYRYLGKI
jgi:DNA-binding LytR/AlgR family response regulator